MPQPQDPPAAPEDVPLRSPMPRKPWLEEEPRPGTEADIGADKSRRQRPATRTSKRLQNTHALHKFLLA